MTVISFPPQRVPDRSHRDAPRAAAPRSSTWCDERAQLRLLANLQRSLVEGLHAAAPDARAVLRALR